MPLGDCNIPEILAHESFLYEEFLFQDTNLSIPYQPYSYVFTTVENIIYRDITNSEGSIATYFATTLSNEYFNKTQFYVYPNPTTNLLHIESGEVEVQNIEIFSLTGKRVLQTTVAKNESIEVGQLQKRMYLLKIKTESGSVVKKFVKE